MSPLGIVELFRIAREEAIKEMYEAGELCYECAHSHKLKCTHIEHGSKENGQRDQGGPVSG